MARKLLSILLVLALGVPSLTFSMDGVDQPLMRFRRQQENLNCETVNTEDGGQERRCTGKSPDGLSSYSYTMKTKTTVQRNKRQVTNMEQAPANTNSFASFLSDLGPQLERAKQVTSLFSALTSSPQQQQQQQQQNQAPNLLADLSSLGSQINSGSQQSPGEMLTQLVSLIRTTQDRGAKAVGDPQQMGQQMGQQMNPQMYPQMNPQMNPQMGQQTVQQSYQQSNSVAASNAQGGIQAALREIGAGLSKIATNNPNLVADVKNLYASVSSRLNSASNSVAQVNQPSSSQLFPPKPSEQLAEGIAKVAMPMLPNPSSA